MTKDVLLYTQEHAVATLTLNRPAARNALNLELLDALLAGLRQADKDDDIRAIVLTGAGSAFCAGGDLASMQQNVNKLQRYQTGEKYAELFQTIVGLCKPIMAAVNGHAIGGGVGLVCVCDLAVAVDTAKFGTPETSVGLFPMMVTSMLMRNVGRKAATEMMFLGHRFSARRAVEIGLINWSAPPGDYEKRVENWASRLAMLSPSGIRLGREAMRVQDNMGLDKALTYLNTMLTLNLSTDDAQEGIRAFFEKRPPKWVGS